MATPNLTRKPPQPRNSSTTLNRNSIRRRTGVPDPLRQDLFLFIRKLQLALAVVTASVNWLHRQAAEQDEDVALVLERHVCDALGQEVDKWEGLLKAQGFSAAPRQ